MRAQARVALALSLVCGIALGGVAVMYVKNSRPHGKAPGPGSAAAAGSAGSGSAGSGSAGSGSAGSGSAGSGSAGSGSGVSASAVDCAALAKVADIADKEPQLLSARGKELSRADKGGSAAMNLAPKYTEITYATTIQVVAGKTAVIHQASDPALPTEYRVDLDAQRSDGADSDRATPRQAALAKDLADKVHACLPTWRIDDTESVDDQTTFHAPDELAYVVAGFGWGDDAGDTTTVTLQVVAEVATVRTDVGGSGSAR